MRQPQVGDNVRFFRSPDGAERGAIVAALVVGGDAPIVHLSWFGLLLGQDGDSAPANFAANVPFGPAAQPGCWRWLASQG